MNDLKKIIKEINESSKRGIIRKLDELGRVVIPIDFRSRNVKDGVTNAEIYQIGKYVVIEILENEYEKKKKFDELGRIVINVEYRSKLNWLEKDEIEIWNYNDKYFILRKVEKECVFCFSNENLVEFKKSFICEKCKKELEEI